MANRRMFSLDVIDTDKFLDMPATSQNLYFHLGLRADDDGFVSSPKKITKLVNCGSDDLNVLISRGFVIPFDDGIMVITHWKQNNYIQADRYKRTLYQEQLSQLTVNNGVYELDTGRIHDVSKMEAQVSIELDNNILCSPGAEPDKTGDNNSDLEQLKTDFEKIYAIYPKKRGRSKAFEYYCAYVKKGRCINKVRYRLTNKQVYLAVRAYTREREEEGTELDYYKNFDTFMSKAIIDYLPGEGEV